MFWDVFVGCLNSVNHAIASEVWMALGCWNPPTTLLLFLGAEVTDVKIPSHQRLRIFLISDLHVDCKQNKEWMNLCCSGLGFEPLLLGS